MLRPKTGWRLALVVIGGWLATATLGCDGRQAVDVNGDGGVADGARRDLLLPVEDAALPMDAGPPIEDGATAPVFPPDMMLPVEDAGPPSCGPELSMGLVTDLTDGMSGEEASVVGQLTYKGKLTQPLASAPMFDREIQLTDDQGNKWTVQYYLPQPGLEFPLTVGTSYRVTVRRRMIPGQGPTLGLVIAEATAGGPWPFLVIAEPATRGQAFDAADPLLAPLEVELIKQDLCPVPQSNCAPLYGDRLRLHASTGAGVQQVIVDQGYSAYRSFFGVSMRVINLVANHQQPVCPGAAPERWSYVMLAQ